MSDSNNTTVLVVDDEPDLAMLYETYLSVEFDVRSANDGQQALDQVDQTVDVALLDRRMPQMSGDELLRRFREQGYEMKVAMLTAVEPDTDIVDMPFNDYKVKPVGRDELIGLVRTLLQRSTYDKQSQEFFSLASKKAALEIAGNDDTRSTNSWLNRSHRSVLRLILHLIALALKPHLEIFLHIQSDSFSPKC